jgi:hypothetical protein
VIYGDGKKKASPIYDIGNCTVDCTVIIWQNNGNIVIIFKNNCDGKIIGG